MVLSGMIPIKLLKLSLQLIDKSNRANCNVMRLRILFCRMLKIVVDKDYDYDNNRPYNNRKDGPNEMQMPTVRL